MCILITAGEYYWVEAFIPNPSPLRRRELDSKSCSQGEKGAIFKVPLPGERDLG
jgi:hypothetical protein